jgi:leucyl-tRNA synthetase
MFFARWDMGGPWNSGGIDGSARWLRRVWALYKEPAPEGKPSQEMLKSLRRKVHTTLKSITNDFEKFEFNTIVSALMELMNEMYKARQEGAAGTPEWDEAQDIYLRMLAPVAPHISEELWASLGKPYSIHTQPWPVVDEKAAAAEQITIVVQINGKVRDRLTLPADITEEGTRKAAMDSETVRKLLDGKTPKQVVVVPKRLVNIVV